METYKDYQCEYPFDGGEWGFTIKARSREEAQERIKQMPWATVKGEIFAIIPISPKGGWWRWLFGARS